MAALVLPSRRIAQPQDVVELAPYWLGKSPVLVASGASQFVNAVNGKAPTLGSTARFQASAVGIGANGTAASTTSSILFEDYEFGGTAPITALAFSDERPSANRSFIGQDTEVILRVSAAGTGVEWILNSFSTNDRATAVANSRSSPGFFAAGSYGPSGKLRAYANTAMSEVTPTGGYGNSTGVFSAIYTQGLNQLFDKRLALVALFRSELSQAELRALSENPWQLFRPLSRSVYFLPADSGGGPVAVSSSLSGAWSSRNLASSSLAGASSVRASTTSSISGSWSVRNPAGSSLAGSWSSRNSSASSLAGSWSVLAAGSASSSLGGAWSVRNTASQSLAGSWSVRSLAGATFTGSWSVQSAGTASSVLAGSWSVRNLSAASVGGSWSVRTSAAASLPGGWQVRNSVAGPSLIGSWSVTALAKATLSGAWSVDGVYQEPVTPLLSIADQSTYLSVADASTYLSVAPSDARQSKGSLM